MFAHFQNSDAGVERGWPEADYVLEAEWFQLTYEGLRVAPDGEPVAVYDPAAGWSVFAADGAMYSDVVIHE